MRYVFKEYVLPILACLLGAILGGLINCDGGCECGGFGVVAQSSQQYRGADTATQPYIDVGDLKVQQQKCVGNICTYYGSVKPWVHNPVAKDIKINMLICRYFVDDALMGETNVARNINVPAKSSRQLVGVDFTFDIMTGFKAGVGLRCIADFGGDYPVAVDDAD